MLGRKQPEVLVVGAGPVGQFAALELASRGIAVEIVEEEFQSAGHSYALALHSETQRLFRDLGLLEAVRSEALQVGTVAFYDGVKRKAEVDLAAAGEPPYLAVVSQDVLERLLEKALERQHVKVHWNHRLARFTQSEGEVETVVDKLVKDSVGYAVTRTEWLVGKSIERPLPFVIGADGHHSLVRRQLGIPFDEVGPAQHFAVFEFTTDIDPGHEMRIALEPGATTLFWPLPGKRCRFSFEIEEPIAPQESRRKDRLIFQYRGLGYPAAKEEELSKLLAERAPWFEGSVGEVYWRTVVRFERRLAGRFGDGRLWLVGDAGHMAAPAGVQSMNVGFREAHELAVILERILRKNGSMNELGAYNQRRLEEWRHLLGLSESPAATAAADEWVRERSDRILGCLPASGEGLRALAAGLGLEVATPVAASG